MLLPYMYDGLPLHAAAAMIAGFVTTVASLPVDIVKTRYRARNYFVDYGT